MREQQSLNPNIMSALLHPFDKISRSSPPEVFLGKDVLEIWSKFTGEHPC